MKNKMWTFSFLLIGLAYLFLTGCKKDDLNDPGNLLGTEWKSETKYGGHYFLLKFPGKTTYELYEFEPGEGLGILERGSYSLDENIIILNSDDGYTDRLKIEGNKISWDDLYGEDEIFTKQ